VNVVGSAGGGSSASSSSPLLAVPEVFGGFELDSSVCFVALLSDGVYRAVGDVVGGPGGRPVNAEIASAVATQFALQATPHGVAQAAVDHVVRQHHSAYEAAPDARARQRYRAHDDMTLVVRAVNFPFAGAAAAPTPPSAVPGRLRSAAAAAPMMAPLSIDIPPPGPAADGDSPPRPFFPHPIHRPAPALPGGGEYIG